MYSCYYILLVQYMYSCILCSLYSKISLDSNINLFYSLSCLLLLQLKEMEKERIVDFKGGHKQGEKSMNELPGSELLASKSLSSSADVRRERGRGREGGREREGEEKRKF